MLNSGRLGPVAPGCRPFPWHLLEQRAAFKSARRASFVIRAPPKARRRSSWPAGHRRAACSGQQCRRWPLSITASSIIAVHAQLLLERFGRRAPLPAAAWQAAAPLVAAACTGPAGRWLPARLASGGSCWCACRGCRLLGPLARTKAAAARRAAQQRAPCTACWGVGSGGRVGAGAGAGAGCSPCWHCCSLLHLLLLLAPLALAPTAGVCCCPCASPAASPA
jgi:hypothetical protein